MIRADFAAITVLISMGAVLGKLTPVQYMMMSALEVPIAIALEYLILRYFKVLFPLIKWLEKRKKIVIFFFFFDNY